MVCLVHSTQAQNWFTLYRVILGKKEDIFFFFHNHHFKSKAVRNMTSITDFTTMTSSLQITVSSDLVKSKRQNERDVDMIMIFREGTLKLLSL